MSFNHLSDDTCTYSRRLTENMSILDYTLNPDRYEHSRKCRHELGLIGGTSVSHIAGNLVDLESELRGQTRFISKCANRQYQPPSDRKQPIINDKTDPISTSKLHLPSCQMISYKETPLPTWN